MFSMIAKFRVVPGLILLTGLGLCGCSGNADVKFPELIDEDPIVRSDAARRLGDSRVTEAVPELVGLLDDADEEVRVTAIRSLERIGDESVVPQIADKHKDPLHTVRLQVALTLGKLLDPVSIPALQTLMYDADDTVRVSAARSLGRIGNQDALDILVEVALIDESEAIRGHVVEVIGEVGAKDQIPRVEDALLTESDDVRAHAARVLGQLGDDSSVPVLIGALEDPFYKVRSLAAHALADLAPGDSEVHEAVRARLEEEPHEVCRVDMAWSLAKGGDRSRMEVIRNLLSRAADDYGRAEAAMALGDIGEDTDIRLLEKAMNDKSGLVRREAYLAVQKLKEA